MTERVAVVFSSPVVTSRSPRLAREGQDEAEFVKPCSGPPPPLAPERHSSCWATARCIAHVDADCFYAQVEELADPSLRFRLLAVRQKQLVVACSLSTRAAVGNLKGLSPTEALKLCPSLHIANGEDLAKYRRVSDRLLLLLQGQPWRGAFPEQKAWLAKQPEGGPLSLRPAAQAPAVIQPGTRVPTSEGQGVLSSNSCCCCCSRTAAARASWSALSAAVAAEAARPNGVPHSVQRLGLDDFYVDVSGAARTVTGCLLSTIQRVCHSAEGMEEASEACCCSLSISISQATQQPRSSGTLLPPSAISCRSCSCCTNSTLQYKAAHVSAAAAEPEKRTHTKRDNCCCKWDLQCPAFVYKGSTDDGSKSAERLLQQPLLLAPLLGVLRRGGHLASLVDAACLCGPSAVTPTEGPDQQQQRHQEQQKQQQDEYQQQQQQEQGQLQQKEQQQQQQQEQQQQQQQEQQQRQQELSSSSTAPTQELPADGVDEQHEQQRVKHPEQQQQPCLQQDGNGAAARCCPGRGGDCVCGVQRLLLIVSAHLTEAMRGLIFSSLGGLTTTGGVSTNKTLAKLAAKLHKPSQQTLLLREHRRKFLEGKLLRSLPGIGSATARRLAAANIRKCSQLLAVSPQRLAEILSSVDPPPPRSYSTARHQQEQEQQRLRLRWPACVASPVAIAQAERLRLLCLGEEEETVQETGCASKTVTVEDSYANRPITSWIVLKTEIKRLVGRLLLRHAEWVDRFGLVASSLKVSLRLRGNRERPARSVSLPQPVRCLLKAASQSTSSSLQSIVGPQGELTSTSTRFKADPAPGSCEGVAGGTPKTTPSGSDADPLHLALFVLALQLFEKILGSSFLPSDSAWALKGVVVFSLTFYGFESSPPSRSSSSPGDQAAALHRSRSPVEVLGKRLAGRQQQQPLTQQGAAGRQLSQPGSECSGDVAPAYCSSAPDAPEERTGDCSLQYFKCGVKGNSNRGTVAGAGGSSAANAGACGEGAVLITVSSRESSPEPSSTRVSASSAQALTNIHGGFDAAISPMPLPSSYVQSNYHDRPQPGLGATEVVEVDSEDSAEGTGDAGAAHSRVSVQQGRDHAKQYNAQQPFANSKNLERSCLPGDSSKASPSPAGLRQARSTRLQRGKRLGHRLPGEQETAGRATKRKPQGGKTEGLALTHFFARK
ncbi:hypothetical protein ACSSS7_000593 [Eimeria intestinalis]